MSRKKSEINEKSELARLIILAPSKNPRTGDETKQVLFTVRPQWSRIGAGKLALPGGKIDESDYKKIFGDSDNEDDCRVLINKEKMTQEQMITVAMIAIIREMLEEFNLVIDETSLIYAGNSVNPTGWKTYVFAMELLAKPMIEMDFEETDGVLWIDEENLKEKTEGLHFNFFADSLQLLNMAFLAL